jgi:tRNA pseudouridine55 synthase
MTVQAEMPVMNFKELEDFMEGQILLVDKPLEWTSFDVVNKVRGHLRHALKVKKIKVGHAGTLDPLATGVLVVCTGKATKRIETLQAQDKSYTATIRLGAHTPCLDAELPVETWADSAHLTRTAIEKAATGLRGSLEQMPPRYSAKKVNGQKAYAVARKGGEIMLNRASIEIKKLEIQAVQHRVIDQNNVVDVEVEIDCTKGTYIRSIARDLGETLGVGGHLIALRRTMNGPFPIANCVQLPALIQTIESLAMTDK